MLDHLSEKFLRYVIRNHKNYTVENVYTQYDKIGIPKHILFEICKKLDADEYISVIHSEHDIILVSLRHKGIVYFCEKRKRNIHDVLTPIKISVLTTLALNLLLRLLPLIIQLLSVVHDSL